MHIHMHRNLTQETQTDTSHKTPKLTDKHDHSPFSLASFALLLLSLANPLIPSNILMPPRLHIKPTNTILGPCEHDLARILPFNVHGDADFDARVNCAEGGGAGIEVEEVEGAGVDVLHAQTRRERVSMKGKMGKRG